MSFVGFMGLMSFAAVSVAAVKVMLLHVMGLATEGLTAMSLVDLQTVDLRVCFPVWWALRLIIQVVVYDYIINMATRVSQSKAFSDTVHSFILLEFIYIYVKRYTEILQDSP